MLIFYHDDFLSQARAYHVLAAVQKLKAEQLTSIRLDRYIYKEVGKRSFKAIGIEQTISEQSVFVWLQILHENAKDWKDFQSQTIRYGERVLQPLLKNLLPIIENWLAKTDTSEPQPPSMPEKYRPWFEPLNYATSRKSQDIQVYETANWITEFSKREIKEYWQSWYKMISDLAENSALGETAPGFPHLLIHRDDNAYILFTRISISQINALLLIHPFITATYPSKATLSRLTEANELELKFADKAQQILDLDDLARYTRRTWPSLALADQDLWRKITNEVDGNLALSAEEEQIIDQMTGTHWGEKRLPCFLDGRAGSGKSTLLSYVFARYCARKLLNGWDGTPLYVTINESLLKNAQEIVCGLLEHNVEIKMELQNYDEREIKNWFRPLYIYLKELLQDVRLQGIALYERFQDPQRISYHRFRRLYLGERLSAEEQRLSCKNRVSISDETISAETAWFVIRALIKGIKTDGYLDPSGFDDLPRETRKAISRDLFLKVYEQIWNRWYRKLWENHGFWDDQDLVRAVLNEAPELPEYTLICCDEAQDLTHIEARLLFRLSILNRYPLPARFPPILPFLFAGDPLQTVNPSGFRWDSLKQLFHDEIQTIASPEIPLNLLSLEHNYRSRQAIVGFLNLIQTWRAYLFHWTSPMLQYGWSPLTGNNPTCFIIDGQASILELRDLLTNTPIIIAAEEDGEMERIKNDALLESIFKEDSEGIYRNLLTTAAAKGHEHPKVVVYGFGEDCPEHIWTEISGVEEERDALQETIRHRSEHFWNKLYVALSRATSFLFIIDTQKGFQNLWEKLIGDSLPGSLSEEMHESLKKPVNGLMLGGKHDLEFLREQDPQGVADRLKKAGEAERNCVLLRKARAFYQSLNMFNEADECQALCFEEEGKFAEAGALWKKRNNLSRAEESYWRGRQWAALNKLYQSYPELEKPERILLASFLSALQQKKLSWPVVIEQFLPQFDNWLKIGNRPPLLSIQWSDFDNALMAGSDQDRSALSPQTHRLLAQIAEQLNQFGRQTGELAAKCWYELKNWTSAIRCWNAIGRIQHIDYYRAMAETTSGVERLKWWNKSGDYEKTLAIWRSRPNYKNDWMEYVTPALKKSKAWKELIEIQLYKQKKSADRAVDSLLEGYKDLSSQEREQTMEIVFRQLLRRKLYISVVKVITEIPKIELDPANAERLKIQMEIDLCQHILARYDNKEDKLYRAELIEYPSVKDWWGKFLLQIENNPDIYCPPLSADDLTIILKWGTDNPEQVEKFLERWAMSDGPNQIAARDALERLRKQIHGPEVIYKRQPQPDDSKISNVAETDEVNTDFEVNNNDNERGINSSMSAQEANREQQSINQQTIKIKSIEQLRLKNFRAYLDACLLLDDFTVVIGQNGAGKSTLREAFEIIKDALTDSLDNALARRGGIDAWIRKGAQSPEKSLSLALQLRLEQGTNQIRALYGFELLQIEGGDYRIFQEHLSFSNEKIPSFHREGDQITTELSAKPPLDPRQLAFPILAGSHPFWQACLDGLKGINAYVLSPEHMRQETIVRDSDSRLDGNGQNAANVLKRLENYSVLHEGLMRRMSSLIKGIYHVRTETWRGKRMLMFEQHGQTNVQLDVTQVSDGTLRILGILLALYQQPSPSLIFIEELEDSIHPEAFASLVEAIEEATERTQIVITSHSPVALMHKPITEARTRLIQWELGCSAIYALQSPPPEPDDYPFSVGEMLQFNAIPKASTPSVVKGGFFEIEVH